jgi:hypothetical protein
MIAHYIEHSEPQLRLPAQQVWRDIVRNSPSSRSKIVHDHLLDVVFELCSSPLSGRCQSRCRLLHTNGDRDHQSWRPPTEKLVGLLGVKSEHLRSRIAWHPNRFGK